MKKINLGCKDELFGWYIRGPYSVAVASIAYGFMREKPQEVQELNAEQKEKLGKLKKWTMKDDGEIDLNLLELYGSLQYILVADEKPKEKAVEILMGRKAWYTKEQTETALSNLLTLS